jgi:hypothetical protein
MSVADTAKHKLENTPRAVFEEIDALIQAHQKNGVAVVRVNQIYDALLKAGLGKIEVINNHYLQVKEVYFLKGWEMTTTTAIVRGSDDSFFTFTRIPKK